MTNHWANAAHEAIERAAEWTDDAELTEDVSRVVEVLTPHLPALSRAASHLVLAGRELAPLVAALSPIAVRVAYRVLR
ncbi:MAG: hypothetical protein IT383_20765 [Deltaproteobacteria bacterium]|nr:hypothetical protein [Deltaproteobacteria bacterium]